MNERTRKSLTMLLALVLCLALLPAQAFALDMQVDAPALTVNTSVIGFAGQEWYVIGYDGSGVYSQSNTATLLLKSSGTPYGNTAFRTGNSTQDDPEWTQYTVSGWYYEGEFTQPNDYNDSTLQNRMVAIADGIPGKELALINTRTLTAVDDINYPITGGDVANQKLWPLSYNEWTTIDDDTVRSFGNYFWLRSPSEASGAFFGLLDGDSYSKLFVRCACGAARPDFILNLSYFLFNSAARGARGKSSATAGSGLVGASAPTGAVKFTVKSASQELDVTATEAQATQSGATLTFGYTGATAVTNQYVSCVLLNDSDEVAYYGKLTDSSSDASGDLSIPLAGVSDGTYTLQIFSEEANGDNYTDFCSEPVSMTLNVTDGVGEVSSFGGTELDTTAPVLSASSVNRAGDTAATIGFTTSEAGTAYYKVVDSGATAPSKEAVAAETSLGAVSGTVSGKSVTLTAGAKDIYVVVKDAADNISDVLKIEAAAYVEPTPTITATAGSGGSISPSGAVNVTEGSDQTFTITPDSGYRINSVTIDGVSQGAITTYTFTNVTANHTINATFTRTSGGGGGGGGGTSTPSTPSTPTAPDYEAEVKEGNASETTLPVTVDKDAETASIDLGSHNITLDGTVVTIPPIPDANTYSVAIPVPDLSMPDGQGAFTLNTDTGSITVPSNMLTGVSGISGSKAEISIGQGDKDNLPDDVKAAIGDRPLVQLTLSIDSRQTEWSNPNAPVTVSIPYTPTAAELANPESIVIWYIDGSGNVVSVPNGRYDPVTGTVTFFTTHFSDYAVAYVHKTFSDLGSVEWARKAIKVMASKGITNGTGDGTTFSPSVNITRADFMVLLIKTLGLTAEFTENFDDVHPGAYYYDAIGVAKKLGIAAGSGNNLFKPTESISRQDMMVLAARALEKYQALKTADTNTVLERFSDRKDIAEYAASSLATLIEAGLIEGSGSKLTPRAYTTRAEVAAFLYKIYNKYPEAPVITAATLTRLAGQSRVDTALSVARAAYPDKISNAVLATADNYPDALAGSVLAYKLDTPILLVGSSEADQKKVLDYLKSSMEPDGTVYILGGTAAVSGDMENMIQSSGFRHITRVAGETRYDTAVKIAEQLNVKTGTPVVLVSGENYPDALSVSSIAAQNQYPILPVSKDGISDAVRQKLAAIKPEKIYIIGLEGAISPPAESQAANITGLATENIIRIGGADRYATSLAVAEYFNLGSQTICIATGNYFPDALAGSIYAAKYKAPIILTDSTLPAQTADYVESRKPSGTVIFGGEAAVSGGIEQQIQQLLK